MTQTPAEFKRPAWLIHQAVGSKLRVFGNWNLFQPQAESSSLLRSHKAVDS